ncbi:Uncharacterised protein [Chlamydia trachomatis]|nr:Uncharacterised protein [Chlamydia trachomatis]
MKKIKQILQQRLDTSIQKIQVSPVRTCPYALALTLYTGIVIAYLTNRENLFLSFLFILSSSILLLNGIWLLLLSRRYLTTKTEERFGTTQKNRLD